MERGEVLWSWAGEEDDGEGGGGGEVLWSWGMKEFGTGIN